MTDDTAEILRTLAGATPWAAYSGMTIVTKIAATIALAAAGIGLILAVMRRMSGSARSDLLSGLGTTGLVFGILGALYGGLNTYVGAQMIHVTRFVILLPSIIECLYALLFGILAWTIARVGNAK